MATVVIDHVEELEALKERRRVSGLDRLDEVWEGVLHMVPAPSDGHGDIESQLHTILRPLAHQADLRMIGQSNLGENKHDVRVPDAALHRPGDTGTWHPTAALVVEIISPGDKTWQKLPFFAAHEVDEVLIVNPEEHDVHWLGLADGKYHPIERSGLIDLSSDQLAELIDWPLFTATDDYPDADG